MRIRIDVRAFLVSALALVAPALVQAQGLDSLIVAKFELSAAQVAGLGSTPVDIVDGVAGHIVKVYDGVFIKRAGPAFTISGGGAFVQVRYDNPAGTPANNFGVAGVLDSTDEESWTGEPAFLSNSGDNLGGRGLRLAVNGGGSYGGMGSDCILILRYWVIPYTAAEADLLPTTPLP